MYTTHMYTQSNISWTHNGLKSITLFTLDLVAVQALPLDSFSEMKVL